MAGIRGAFAVFQEAGLFWALALVGIGLRLQRFLLGRSFRNDEAALALTFRYRSLRELMTNALPGGLTAPVGFLTMEKLVSLALGDVDYVLRLLPLIAGCASVLVMMALIRRVLPGIGGVFALGAFAVNWMLLFYSSDLKQYSTDVLFTVLLYWSLAVYLKDETTPKALLLLGSGLIALVCSHPAIFILGALGAVLIVHHSRDARKMRFAAIIVLVWVVAFAALYLSYYRVVGQTFSVVDYWNDLDALMPVPPWKDPGWFPLRAGAFFESVVGLSPLTWLNAALFAAGIFSFYREGRWQWSLALLGSTLLALLASGLVNYPFKGRLILFLIPSTLLAIGKGLEYLVHLLPLRRPWSLAAGLFGACALLWAPVSSTSEALAQRRSFPYREDLKPVLASMQKQGRPDDFVVLYDQVGITYEYYAPFYGLDNGDALRLENNRNHPRRYRREMDALPRDQRTWLVFSSVLDMPDGTDVRTFLLDYVREGGGTVLEQYNADEVSFADLVVPR